MNLSKLAGLGVLAVIVGLAAWSLTARPPARPAPVCPGPNCPLSPQPPAPAPAPAPEPPRPRSPH